MTERYDFRTKRLFIDQALSADSTLTAERAQANYLLNVLRLKKDDKILLFNGRDGEWLAQIEPTGRKACDLIPTECLRAQPQAYELSYYFAPLKQGRLDYMVQKAVEMGVGHLVPVISDYTQVHKLNLDRLRANIVEAAEQCGILNIPELSKPRALTDVIEQWPVEQADRTLIFCDELANKHDQAQRLDAIKDHKHGVLIGPEGGFSDKERTLLRSKEFVVGLSLGPRILRADTAAVAALAIVQAFIGDLR